MSDPVAYRPHSPGTQPPYDVPAYRGTTRRHPKQALHKLPQTVTETSGPRFSPAHFPPSADLTTNTTGKPAIGERIIVAGRVLDEDGRPVPNTMVEIWQCNATGRYDHPADQHDAPLDPNFHGAGRVFTDDDGKELTCGKRHGEATELKSGTPANQHVVAVKPAGKGSEFALVFVQKHGKEGNI